MDVESRKKIIRRREEDIISAYIFPREAHYEKRIVSLRTRTLTCKRKSAFSTSLSTKAGGRNSPSNGREGQTDENARRTFVGKKINK